MIETVYHTATLAVEFNVNPEIPPGANGLLKILNWGLWGVMLSCVAGVIISGGKFAWEKWSQGHTDAPKMLIGSLAGAVVAGSANALLNAVTG